MGNQHNVQDEAEERTASYEEDPGDSVDIPTSVEAHVSLAHTYRTSFLPHRAHKS